MFLILLSNTNDLFGGCAFRGSATVREVHVISQIFFVRCCAFERSAIAAEPVRNLNYMFLLMRLLESQQRSGRFFLSFFLGSSYGPIRMASSTKFAWIGVSRSSRLDFFNSFGLGPTLDNMSFLGFWKRSPRD